MQLFLSKISNWLNSLKYYQLVEIYIIILLIFLSPLYFFDFEYKFENKINIPFLSTHFEKLALENDIKIIKNIVSNNDINLEVVASKDNLLDFINKLQNYNKNILLDKVILSKKEENLVAILNLKKVDYDIEVVGLFANQKKLKQPQIQQNTSQIQERKRYELKAIINNFVLINDKWYELGKFIDNYKIKEIDINTIVLEKENEKIELKVFKDVYNK